MKSIRKVVTSVCILSCCTLNGIAMQKSDGEVITFPKEAIDVEVIVRFVAFPKEKIDEIVTANVIKPLTVDDLSTLLKQGHGRIISSPRVITQSGNEALVRSAVVYRTPQDIDVQVYPIEGTNVAPIVVTKPQDFQDFDIGVTVQVTPVVSDDGTRINIDFRPRLTGKIEWETTQISCIDSNSEKKSVDYAFPRIKTLNCLTSLTMQSGATVIVSGGMSDREEQEEIFVLLTCRVLNSVVTEEEISK